MYFAVVFWSTLFKGHNKSDVHSNAALGVNRKWTMMRGTEGELEQCSRKRIQTLLTGSGPKSPRSKTKMTQASTCLNLFTDLSFINNIIHMYRKPTRARITYNCTHTSITKSRGNVTPDLHHVHTNRNPNPNNKLASRPDNIIIKPCISMFKCTEHEQQSC